MVRDFQLMKNHLNVLAPENILRDQVLRDDDIVNKFRLEDDVEKEKEFNETKKEDAKLDKFFNVDTIKTKK